MSGHENVDPAPPPPPPPPPDTCFGNVLFESAAGRIDNTRGLSPVEPAEGRLLLTRRGASCSQRLSLFFVASDAEGPDRGSFICDTSHILEMNISSVSDKTSPLVLWVSYETDVLRKCGFLFKVSGKWCNVDVGFDAVWACKTLLDGAIAGHSGEERERDLLQDAAAACVSASESEEDDAVELVDQCVHGAEDPPTPSILSEGSTKAHAPHPLSHAEAMSAASQEEEWRRYLYRGETAPSPKHLLSFFAGASGRVARTVASTSSSVQHNIQGEMGELGEMFQTAGEKGVKTITQGLATLFGNTEPAGGEVEEEAEERAPARLHADPHRGSVSTPVLPASGALRYDELCCDVDDGGAATPPLVGVTPVSLKMVSRCLEDCAGAGDDGRARRVLSADIFSRGGTAGGTSRKAAWDVLLRLDSGCSQDTYTALLQTFNTHLHDTEHEAHPWFSEQEKAIEKDATRTDRGEAAFKDGSGPSVELLSNLLRAYVTEGLGRELGYIQGMSDVASVAVIVCCGDNDANDTEPTEEVPATAGTELAAYRCFLALMQFMGPNFGDHAEASRRKVMRLLKCVNLPLHAHLQEHDPHAMFIFRWMFMHFKREFALSGVLRIWDVTLAAPVPEYETVLAVALLNKLGVQLQQLESFSSIVRFCQSLLGNVRACDVLAHAHSLYTWLESGGDLKGKKIMHNTADESSDEDGPDDFDNGEGEGVHCAREVSRASVEVEEDFAIIEK